MSLILDALRRERDAGERPHSGRAARADVVLQTLGYSRSDRKSRVSGPVRAVVFWVGGAIVVAVGLWQFWPAERGDATLTDSRTAVAAPGASATTDEPSRQPIPEVAAFPGQTDRPEVPRSAPTVAPGTEAALPADDDVPVPERVVAPRARPPVAPAPERVESIEPPGIARSDRAEIPQVAPQPPPPVAIDRGVSTAAPDHFRLALFYHRGGDFERALFHYRAVLDRNELNAEAHNNLGLLYQEKGLLAEAVTSFERAINIDEGYAKAHNNLGVVRLSEGKVDAATAEFRLALELDPANVETMVNLALAQKASGGAELGIETLRRALDADARSAPSHYNLALLYEETGDPVRAADHYVQFLEHAGVQHANLAADVRSRLESLASDAGVP